MSSLHRDFQTPLGPVVRIARTGVAACLLLLCAFGASAQKAPDWWAGDSVTKAPITPSAGGSQYRDPVDGFFFPPLLTSEAKVGKRAVYEGDTQTIQFDVSNQYPYHRSPFTEACVFTDNSLPNSITASSFTVCFLTLSPRPDTPMQPVDTSTGRYHPDRIRQGEWNTAEYGDFTCPEVVGNLAEDILADGWPLTGADGKILKKIGTLPAPHARMNNLSWVFTVPTLEQMGAEGITTYAEVYVKVWFALPNYVPDINIPQIYTEFYGVYPGWDYLFEGNNLHNCLGPAFIVYRKTPPLIVVEPSTITLVSDQRRDQPRLIASVLKKQSAASVAPASAAKPPSGARDQRPQFWTDQVIVRLRIAEAARLHAARLGANVPAMLATENLAPLGLSDLPPGCTGIKPYFSGDDKVRRIVEKKLPDLGKMIGQGAALSPQQTALVDEALVFSAEPDDSPGMFYVTLEKGADPREVCKALEKRPDVVFASLSRICYPSGARASQTESSPLPLSTVMPSLAPGLQPDDPFYPEQWNLDRINVPAVWAVSTETPRMDPEIRVCVVDSGVRSTHEEFRGRLVDSKDVYVVSFSADPTLLGRDAYTNDDPNDDDLFGHGTACAALVGAYRGNRLGIAGAAAVRIIPVNADAGVDLDGNRVYKNYEDGVLWGVDHGAKVISLSLSGTGGATSAERSAARYAAHHDVVVCASAGDDDGAVESNAPGGSIPSYITVGAVDAYNNRVRPPLWWWGSNFGSTLHVVAPGQGFPGIRDPAILALGNLSDTEVNTELNGTSAATPQVAGLCALLRTEYPKLSTETIALVLFYTARDQVGLPQEDTPGWDPYYGWGLVDAEAALWTARHLTPTYFTIYNRGTQPLTITKFEMVQVLPPPPPEEGDPLEPPVEPPPGRIIAGEDAEVAMTYQKGIQPLAITPPDDGTDEPPGEPIIELYPKPSWLLWAPEPPFVIPGMSQTSVLVDPGYIQKYRKPAGILRIQIYSSDPRYVDAASGKMKPYPGMEGEGAVNLEIVNWTAAQNIPWNLLD